MRVCLSVLTSHLGQKRVQSSKTFTNLILIKYWSKRSYHSIRTSPEIKAKIYVQNDKWPFVCAATRASSEVIFRLRNAKEKQKELRLVSPGVVQCLTGWVKAESVE